MKAKYFVCVVVAALVASACKEDRLPVQRSDHEKTTTEELSQIQKVTRLNLEQPVLQGENLERLYLRAVFDFADYQVKNPPIGGDVRGRRLGQLRDMVWLYSDAGGDILQLKPGQFAGINFETPLGSLLTNAELEEDADQRSTVIGAHSFWYSESRMRAQVSLGWIATTGHSWTFLYEIDKHGAMLLRKTMDHGGDFPEGWIDLPPYQSKP